MTKPSLSDYGTYDESTVPRLWNGVVGAWCPSLGPTGSRLHDFSRFNNWGTLTNMDPPTDWVVDGGQYALDFDGSNDYTPTAENLQYGLGYAYAISVWVRPAALPTSGNFMSMLCLYDVIGGGVYGFDLRLQNSGGTQQLGLVMSDGGLSGGGDTNYTLATATWTHLCATRTAGVLDMWVDGKFAFTITNSKSISVISGQKPLTIGAFGYYTPSSALLGRYFNGRIDDVQIRNRGLTGNDIRELYLLGRGGMFQRRRVRRGYVSEAVNRRRRLICGAEC